MKKLKKIHWFKQPIRSTCRPQTNETCSQVMNCVCVKSCSVFRGRFPQKGADASPRLSAPGLERPLSPPPPTPSPPLTLPRIVLAPERKHRLHFRRPSLQIHSDDYSAVKGFPGKMRRHSNMSENAHKKHCIYFLRPFNPFRGYTRACE